MPSTTLVEADAVDGLGRMVERDQAVAVRIGQALALKHAPQIGDRDVRELAVRRNDDRQRTPSLPARTGRGASASNATKSAPASASRGRARRRISECPGGLRPEVRQVVLSQAGAADAVEGRDRELCFQNDVGRRAQIHARRPSPSRAARGRCWCSWNARPSRTASGREHGVR